jgi:hypothetical protein
MSNDNFVFAYSPEVMARIAGGLGAAKVLVAAVRVYFAATHDRDLTKTANAKEEILVALAAWDLAWADAPKVPA